MINGITTIERAIIESLVRKSKDLKSLTKDLDIHENVIFNSLNFLIENKMVTTFNGSYSIQNVEKWQKKINSSINTNYEFHELSTGIQLSNIEHRCKDFKIKKIWMDREEKAIFKSMIYNLEKFLDDIAKKNIQNHFLKTKDQIVFMQGHSSYSNICNALLET